ncbi:MAG: putative Ig domain-containing protein [Candidatus Neomarinimicrobiota bacterium]
MKFKITSFFVACLVILFANYALLCGQSREPEIFPFKQSNTVLIKIAGGFNFDNDDNLDVVGIASLVDGRGQMVPRSTYLVHLEESASGDFAIQWKYNLPQDVKGDFTDLAVVDWNKNGSPVLAATLSITETGIDTKPGWLLLFQYAGGFDQEPFARLTADSVFSIRPRPTYLSVGDVDGNGRRDLVISSAGPGRNISIITNPSGANAGKLSVMNYSGKLPVLLGLQPFRAIVANVDAATGDEIAIFGGKQDLEVEIYRADLKEPLCTYKYSGINRNDFDLAQIAAGDLDGDGFTEFVLPLRSGGAQILWRETGVLKSALMFPGNTKISAIALTDINDNNLADILMIQANSVNINRYEYGLSGNLSDLKLYNNKMYSNPVLNNIKYLSIAPVISASGKKTGAIVAPFLHQNFDQHGLCYWSLEDVNALAEQGLVETVLGAVDSVLAQEDKVNAKEPITATPFSEMDLLKQQLSGLEGEEIALSPLGEGENRQAVSSGGRKIVKPDILTHPGESVRYTLNIPGLSLDDTKNLNVNVDIPPGMKFDLANKLFTWVPADSQLGLHKNSATISWSGKKEIRTFTVYVNSVPKITTTIPSRDIIQIGETFHFQMEVRDENRDAVITYKLLNCPAGATISASGEILWKPSFEQFDWYDFLIEISDGYDTDNLAFALFVNHPVSIQSTAPNMTAIGKKYTYQSVISDNNKGAYLACYMVSPRVENWRQSGLLETRILDDAVRNNIGKYIERYRKSFPLSVTPGSATGVPKNLFQDIFEDSNKVVFVYNLQTAKGMEASQIVESFFSNLNMSTPKVTRPVRRYLYTFSLKDPLAGLTMDGDGLITWTPTATQFDFQSISYTVTDGYFSAEEHAQVYVNYPPNITSSPDTNAYVNTLWQYEVKVADLNTDSKLSFELLNAPDGMVISPQGVISWRPTDLQINGHFFTVKVSDGLAQDTQKKRVYVNVKPRILSVPKPVALTNLKYEYQLEAEDANGDPLTYKVVRMPKYANFDPETGMVTWTPRKAQKGVNDIVLEVVDSHGWSTLQEFQVHVFNNPGTRRLSFLRDTISLLALIGVIVWAVGNK